MTDRSLHHPYDHDPDNTPPTTTLCPLDPGWRLGTMFHNRYDVVPMHDRADIEAERKARVNPRTDRVSAAKARAGCGFRGPAPGRLRRLQAPVRLRLTHQRVAFGMGDRFDRQINVEVRPVQVLVTRQLDPRDLCNGSLFEPRKLLERHKELLLADE